MSEDEDEDDELDKIPHQELEEGSRVAVRNTDGTLILGTVTDLRDDTAGEHMVGQQTLVDYWAGEGIEVDEDEKVIDVRLSGSASHSYSYPESRVRPDITNVSGLSQDKAPFLRLAGYETIVDLMEADQQELASVDNISDALAARIKAHVGDLPDKLASMTKSTDEFGIECPECNEKFDPQNEGAIEGDKGEIFCSLECLHEVYE